MRWLTSRRRRDLVDVKRIVTCEHDDLLEIAWGIIANATDWDLDDRAEWRVAAERWRDRYHDTLSAV